MVKLKKTSWSRVGGGRGGGVQDTRLGNWKQAIYFWPNHLVLDGFQRLASLCQLCLSESYNLLVHNQSLHSKSYGETVLPHSQL